MNREDFPILSRKVHGRSLVYLDNAATTHKPRQVIDAISSFYENSNANIHRGVHALADEATTMYEDTRDVIRRTFNVPKTHEVVFTRNATHALNIVAAGIDVANHVTSIIDHHANFVPMQQHAKSFSVIGLDESGYVYDGLPDALVSVSMLSNVTGDVMNYQDVVHRTRKAGSYSMLDASQAAPHMLLDVEDSGADFVAFTAHKMLGPTGLGVLIGRRTLLDSMRPFEHGGEMIEHVSVQASSFRPAPNRFEAGTMPIAQVAGFRAALDYLNRIGKARIASHERELVKLGDDLLNPLRAYKSNKRIPIFSLTPKHPYDVGVLLDKEGFATRAGHHCAMPFMESRNLKGTLRASAYLYNTQEEIGAFARAYEKYTR